MMQINKAISIIKSYYQIEGTKDGDRSQYKIKLPTSDSLHSEPGLIVVTYSGR